jgi:hypothetical protein
VKTLRADILKDGDVVLSGVSVRLTETTARSSGLSGRRARMSLDPGHPLRPGETYELRFEDGKSGEFAVSELKTAGGGPDSVTMEGVAALRDEQR